MYFTSYLLVLSLMITVCSSVIGTVNEIKCMKNKTYISIDSKLDALAGNDSSHNVQKIFHSMGICRKAKIELKFNGHVSNE